MILHGIQNSEDPLDAIFMFCHKMHEKLLIFDFFVFDHIDRIGESEKGNNGNRSQERITSRDTNSDRLKCRCTTCIPKPIVLFETFINPLGSGLFLCLMYVLSFKNYFWLP